MNNFKSWEEIQKSHPNEWIILGEVQYNSDGALFGGVIIESCTDKTIDDAIIKYDKQGKNYLHLRTSTYFNNGVQTIC